MKFKSLYNHWSYREAGVQKNEFAVTWPAENMFVFLSPSHEEDYLFS